jgi:hypothetical protein
MWTPEKVSKVFANHTRSEITSELRKTGACGIIFPAVFSYPDERAGRRSGQTLSAQLIHPRRCSHSRSLCRRPDPGGRTANSRTASTNAARRSSSSEIVILEGETRNPVMTRSWPNSCLLSSWGSPIASQKESRRTCVAGRKRS